MAALLVRGVRDMLKRADFATVPRRQRHKKKWTFLPRRPLRSESDVATSPSLPGLCCPPGEDSTPSLTLELPLAPRKGYSDHPPDFSPKPGKRFSDFSHLMGSPYFSRAPFSGLTCSPEISSLTDQSSSLPRPILCPPPPPSSPIPQALLRPGGCCFEPASPHLGKPSCREPILSGSSPPSPCVERFRFVGSPPARPRSPHCSWISPPRTPRPCPRGPCIDQHSYLCYYGGYPPALVTNPVTSLPLTHVPLETGPVLSPPLTHKSLGTGLVISPPLVHRHMETRPIISPPPQRVLDTGPMTSTLLSSWSSGRSYNGPPLSSASSPPTDNFYRGHVKRPDSHEPKPQLDPTFGKNYCGSPLSSQPGTSSCPSSPQEGSYHYSHLPPEAHIPAPGNPYYAIHVSPGSTGNPQLQDSRKSCFESIYSWETGGSSYLRITPGAMISGPSCPQEAPLPLSSHCPCSAFFPSPPCNQFMNPPQSPRCRSCKESPAPVCPQAKSPKSLEVKQPHSPHSHSLVTQHTPDQPSAPKPSSSPPPPSRPSGISGPSSVVTTITTCANSCPKELPQETTAPAVVPRTLKTVIPASLPLRLPCDPILPSSYAQTGPRGPLIGPPCSTHVYSMVPPTPDPGLLSGPLNQCTSPLQCQNQPVVPPGVLYSTPRGPLLPHRQPVVPPCSTHIYSFIPLRTPFDPQNLPIAPRGRGHRDAMPCGLHVYSMASRDSHKESSQIPYSCPVPSTKSSSCSTNASCSSILVINECQSSDSKNTHQSASGSQSESVHGPTTWTQRKTFHLSRSRSGSNSTQESTNKNQRDSPPLLEDQGQSENTKSSRSQGPIKSALRNRSRSQSKSPHHRRRQGQSRSRSKSPCKSPHRSRGHGHSKSPHRSRGHGHSKSPHRNKK